MMEKINNLEKAVTWKWVDKVSSTGLRYRQKYRAAVKENQDDQSLEEREAEFKRSVNNAALKDKLNYALKIKGKYYDTDGKQIHVPDRFKDVVDKLYNPKNNIRTFGQAYLKSSGKNLKGDFEKDHMKDLENKIEKNDKILSIGLEEDIRKHNSLNTPEVIRNQIHTVLSDINKDTKLHSIITALEIVRKKLNENINPAVHFKFQDKPNAADLEDLIERLKKFKDDDNVKDFSMSDLRISNLDDFDDEDFPVKNHKIKDQIHLNKLYERGEALQNRDLVKVKKKIDKETDPDNWGGEKQFEELVGELDPDKLKGLLVALRAQDFEKQRDKNVKKRQIKIIMDEIRKKK